MITKSLILLSIAFNMLGLGGLEAKFDDAVVRDFYNSSGTKVVEASNLSQIVLPEVMSRPIVKLNAEKPTANAKRYLLADLDSGVVLAKQNMHDQVPIASTTKIMTAVVALENFELSEVVTVSEKASVQVGADAYLRPGEKITVEQLLNCMLIKSGNDAAYALAEHINSEVGSETSDFVEKMNQKAKELGMENTKYKDPAGLDVTGYSSAYDLFLITKYALKNDTFRNIVKKSEAVAKNIDSTIWHELKNSNRLVAEYKYPGAIGIKTGYMPEAGHCLVGAATREDNTLVSIVLSTYSDTPQASADESKRLLDWGFDNVEWR